MKRVYFNVLFFSTLFFTSCVTDNSRLLEPVNLNGNHICACDSMVIIEYKGPKAQILWKSGKRSFYCEVKEAFFDILDNVKSKRVSAFFVQDFSYVEWGSYVDNWIKGEEAYYIIDSDKEGAMGITYVPFSLVDKALQFKECNNGKLLSYSDIDINVLLNSDSLMKDRVIFE